VCIFIYANIPITPWAYSALDKRIAYTNINIFICPHTHACVSLNMLTPYLFSYTYIYKYKYIYKYIHQRLNFVGVRILFVPYIYIYIYWTYMGICVCRCECVGRGKFMLYGPTYVCVLCMCICTYCPYLNTSI